MKISRIALVVAVLLLVSTAPALATQPAHEVPIHGTVLGTHWIDEAAPGCDDDALWRFYSSGAGTMSHLGRVEYELTQCSFFDPMKGFTFRDGTITFIAANGDELIVAQEGSSDAIFGDSPEPLGFTVDATWMVVDGTGRFAHATGYGWMNGAGDVPGGDALFNLPDGLATFSFGGVIAYEASDRSK